jgi:hypothetical protein
MVADIGIDEVSRPLALVVHVPISLYESLSRDLYRVHVTFGGHYLIINIQYSS